MMMMMMMKITVKVKLVVNTWLSYCANSAEKGNNKTSVHIYVRWIGFEPPTSDYPILLFQTTHNDK